MAGCWGLIVPPALLPGEHAPAAASRGSHLPCQSASDVASYPWDGLLPCAACHRPLSALTSSLDNCLSDIKATLEASSTFYGGVSSGQMSALRSSLAAQRRAENISPLRPRGTTDKHPALWTATELSTLMEAAGFDKIDARACLRAGLTGEG